jgi:hypothetical protein
VVTAARKADPVLVWPDMRAAVTVFFALGTQWRVGPAGIMGLEYQAIRPTAELMGVDFTPGDMVDLRSMEAEALAALRRKR